MRTSSDPTKKKIANPLAHPVGRYLFRIIAFPMRLRYRWTNRKRQALSEGAIREIASRIEEAHRAGSKNYEAIFNTGLFVALVERDLSAYSSSLLMANSVWHQQFAARGMAVLLFEAADDLPDLLRNKLRPRMIDVGLNGNWLTTLDGIVAEFEAFHGAHAPFLGNVRNFVGAHRDHRALRQLQLLDSIDSFEVFRLGAEFSAPLRAFINFQMQLMQFANHPGTMVKEAARLVERRLAQQHRK